MVVISESEREREVNENTTTTILIGLTLNYHPNFPKNMAEVLTEDGTLEVSVPNEPQAMEENSNDIVKYGSTNDDKVTDSVIDAKQDDGTNSSKLSLVLSNQIISHSAASKKRSRSEVDDDVGDDDIDNYDNTTKSNYTENVTNEQKSSEGVFSTATTRLSKWIERLKDPNRPRGYIEPPKIIPLNDEFLKEFGKREKETDDALGRSFEIDRTIDDADDVVDVNDTSSDTVVMTSGAIATKGTTSSIKPIHTRKVRLANLLYTTNEIDITNECSKYGNVEAVNLILDKDDPTKSIGIAYVTFETPEAAQECITNLRVLHGRTIYTNLAKENTRTRDSYGGSTNNNGGGHNISRYYVDESSKAMAQKVKMLGIKCFHCGLPGHLQTDCPNAKQFRPCPLCAGSGALLCHVK